MLEFLYPTRLQAQPGKPLNARFLVLTGKRTAEGEMIAQLHTKAIDGTFEYEALSHTWGEEGQPVKTICCNSQRLSVRERLYGALLQLERRSWDGHQPPRMFWVDMICINQGDTTERSYQVSCMRKIYSRSKRVIIWLGEEYYEAKDAFKFLKYMEAVGQRLKSTNVQRTLTGRPADYPQLDIPNSGSHYSQWANVTVLLLRAWFGRVWVIQEVAVAPCATVLCGSSSMDWESFQDAVHTMDYIESGNRNEEMSSGPEFSYSASFPAAIATARNSFRDQKPRALLDLLISHHTFKATDKRDHIYALCGIAADTGPADLHVVPNYDKDAKEIYQELAKAIITESSNLELFHAIRPDLIKTREQKGVSGLPSWVPDWSVSPETDLLYRPGSEDLRSPFSAAGSSKCIPIFFENELRVRGLIFDRIVQLGAVVGAKVRLNINNGIVFKEYGSLPLWFRIFGSWGVISELGKQKKYVNGEDMRSVFLHTVFAGSLGGSEQCNANSWSKSLYRTAFVGYIFNYLGSKGLAKIGHAFTILYGLAHMLRHCREKAGRRKVGHEDISKNCPGFHRGRAVARSEHGYIALVPGETRRGDVIALLEGGRVPFILRSRKRSRWKLIGEVYVHGIMRGEEWKVESCEEIRLV